MHLHFLEVRSQRIFVVIKHFLWSKFYPTREYVSSSTFLPVASAQTGPLQGI